MASQGTLAQLSTPAKTGFGAMVIGAIGAALMFLKTNWIIITIVVCGLLVLALFLVLINALLRSRQRKKSEVLINELDGIDSLRRKFREGIEEFRKRGKDRDAIRAPWFIMVGEAGAGKTEAIRHAGINLIRGMNNMGAGTGGTLNVDWWIAERAILLDTAGRLMFEERIDGQANEWEEVLRLLKMARPDCPINGMILAIPATTLIADNAQQIQGKAEKIAQEFDRVQSSLGVRFPVYVIITKADKITGLREYFANVNDPAAQNQMLGWSNPDSLDKPFRPELVEQHLGQIIDRLKSKRLSLLKDPKVVEEHAPRRIDQVDALYPFPENLRRTGSRLRTYLEIIFTPNEWSMKPLFLRGIYFTSAMREGAALDQDLAAALNVSVEKIEDLRIWEKERTFFLKDAFVEKAFAEKGLVTNHANVSRSYNGRRIVIYTAAALGAIAVLAWTFFGITTLQSSVGMQSDFWATIDQTNTTESDSQWYAVASRDKDSNKVTYRGDQLLKNADNPNDPLSRLASNLKIETREDLQALNLLLATHDLEVPPIFSMYSKVEDLQNKNRLNHQAFFERAALEPLVTEAAIDVEAHKIPGPTGVSDDGSLDPAFKAAVQNLLLFRWQATSGDKYDGVLCDPSQIAALWKSPDVLARENLPKSMDFFFRQRAGRTSFENIPLLTDSINAAVGYIRDCLESHIKNRLQFLNTLAGEMQAYSQLEQTVLGTGGDLTPFVPGSDSSAGAIDAASYGQAVSSWHSGVNSLQKADFSADLSKVPELQSRSLQDYCSQICNAERDASIKILEDLKKAAGPENGADEIAAATIVNIIAGEDEIKKTVIASAPDLKTLQALNDELLGASHANASDWSFARRLKAYQDVATLLSFNGPAPSSVNDIVTTLQSLESAYQQKRAGIPYGGATTAPSSASTLDALATKACAAAADWGLKNARSSFYNSCAGIMDAFVWEDTISADFAGNSSANPPSPPPQIPLAANSQPFDTRYDPPTAQKYLNQSAAILQKLPAENLLDANAANQWSAELGNWMKKRNVYTDRYLQYWNGELDSRTTVAFTDWVDVRKCNGLHAADINSQLKSLGGVVAQAIGILQTSNPTTAPDAANSPPSALTALSAELNAGNADLNDPNFLKHTDDVLTAWQNLGDTVTSARGGIAKVGPQAVERDMYIAQPTPDYATHYWAEFTVKALLALSSDSQKIVQSQLQTLQILAARFPIGKSSGQEMSQQQFNDFNEAYKQVSVPSPVSTPAQTQLVNDLVNGVVGEGNINQDWLAKVGKAIDAVAKCDTCTLTILPGSDQDALAKANDQTFDFQNFAAVLEVDQGTTNLGPSNIGDARSIPNVDCRGPLTIKFYQHISDHDAGNNLPNPPDFDQWGVYHLIRDYDGVKGSAQELTVPLTVVDRNQQQHVLYLKLSNFSTDMVPPGDWPDDKK